MTFDLKAWTRAHVARVDSSLEQRFGDAWPTAFVEPLRYPLFTGGKRVRPLLAFAAYQALRGPQADLAPVLPGAVAIELVHTYSLVHDDLPCMDDDDERRGRPTVHKAFDEGIAVLVGDSLLTEAFQAMCEAPLPAETRLQLISELSRASGYAGMIGGQVADVTLGSSITEVETLARLHRLKTGELIRLATRIGALSAGASDTELDALTQYGEAVGLAFQLADDILDADEVEDDDGPPSYVRLMGVEGTRARAHELAEQARTAAEGLPHPDALLALARFIVERDV